MLQEMKIKPFNNKKHTDNLAFPLHKKNAITTTPIPQSEILSSVKDFFLLTTKDVDVIPPKIDMIKIDPVYYNTSSIPIDTTSKPSCLIKNSNNETNYPKKQTTTTALTNNRPLTSASASGLGSALTSTSRVSLLKKQLESISSYENQISDKDKIAKALYFNIESLESKISHMKRELQMKRNTNYYTSDQTNKIFFEQDKTRSIQNQIDNEMPSIREEIDQVKEHLIQLEIETESISLVASKLNTERVFVIEDIKKISRVINEINKERMMKEDQISELKQDIHEIKIKAHECSKANDKFAKEIQQLIEI